MKNLLLDNRYDPEKASGLGPGLGIPQPPLFLERKSEKVIALPGASDITLQGNDLAQIMAGRKSRRLYEDEPLSLQELSFLLFMTQGVRETAGTAFPVTVRTVPSAGSRHALETLLFINRAEGLEPGYYAYLPDGHRLAFLSTGADLPGERRLLQEAFCGQSFFAGSAVCFLWTAVPERMEWRYGEQAGKLILLDAGHVCENLYLAAAAIGCGVCANTCYIQEKADALLSRFSPENSGETLIYAASVGKI